MYIFTFFYPGRLSEYLVVTCNRQVLGTFERCDGLKAFVCQFGALYVYGLSFEKGSTKSKESTKKETSNETNVCDCLNFVKVA